MESEREREKIRESRRERWKGRGREKVRNDSPLLPRDPGQPPRVSLIILGRLCYREGSGSFSRM